MGHAHTGTIVGRADVSSVDTRRTVAELQTYEPEIWHVSPCTSCPRVQKSIGGGSRHVQGKGRDALDEDMLTVVASSCACRSTTWTVEGVTATPKVVEASKLCRDLSSLSLAKKRVTDQA